MTNLCLKAFFAFSVSLLPTVGALAQDLKPLEIYRVSKGVYRGSNPSDVASMSYLQAVGVKTIVDLQGGDRLLGFFPTENLSAVNSERALAAERGLRFFNVPVPALRTPNEMEIKLIRQLIGVMNDPRYQPLYIHCEKGMDRTGFVIALHRVFNQGWRPEDAYSEMIAYGHRGFSGFATDSLRRLFFSLTDPLNNEKADIPPAAPLAAPNARFGVKAHPEASRN